MFIIIYFFFFIVVTYLLLLFLLWKKNRKIYKPCNYTELDRLAVDQSIVVLHLYAQHLKKIPFCLKEKTIEKGFLVHLPKPNYLFENWEYHPICADIGSKSWSQYLFRNQSMIGSLGINRKEKIITMAFRNSRTLADWYHNVDFSFAYHKDLSYPGPLHTGYAEIFCSCLPKIKQLLDQVVQQEPDIATYDLLLTGHSLGGSLAVFIAIYLAENKIYHQYFNQHNIKLVTFGAPYVGTKGKKYDFAQWMQQRIHYIRCFESSKDFMPILAQYFENKKGKRAPQTSSTTFVEPIAPARPIVFNAKNLSLGLYRSHSITQYRRSIYQELKIDCKPLYKYFM